MDLLKKFNESISNYREDKNIWEEHNRIFKEFWSKKILNSKITDLSDSDYDPVIRLLDVKARGNTKNDITVARIGLRQGIWYRLFNDLKNKKDIRQTLSEIFNAENNDKIVKLINKLKEENEKNKNGLTGKNASALNALLCINNPNEYISSVSLKHRFQIINAFNFTDTNKYKNYGEQIVYSNRDIIRGFEARGIKTSTRVLTLFLYKEVKSFWMRTIDDDADVSEDEESDSTESIFVLEKHFEDFLIGNWESTELGKRYDLIEENGEVKSQQYKTDIGKIDLLVTDKKNGSYVVIELKKNQTCDDTIGQLSRYMGWIKDNLAKGKEVKGIVIAKDYDEKFKYALSIVPNTEFLSYKVKFSVEKPK